MDLWLAHAPFSKPRHCKRPESELGLIRSSVIAPLSRWLVIQASSFRSPLCLERLSDLAVASRDDLMILGLHPSYRDVIHQRLCTDRTSPLIDGICGADEMNLASL